MEDSRLLSNEKGTMNRSLQPPDQAAPEMEQISMERSGRAYEKKSVKNQSTVVK